MQLRKLRETKKNDITSDNVHDDKGNNDSQPIDDIFVEGDEDVDGNRQQKPELNGKNISINIFSSRALRFSLIVGLFILYTLNWPIYCLS